MTAVLATPQTKPDPLVVPTIGIPPGQASKPLKVVLWTLGAIAFSIVCQWQMIGSENTIVALNVFATATLVAVGTTIGRSANYRRWDSAAIICGLLWSARWAGSWNTGPWPMLSGFFYLYVFIVGARAIETSVSNFRTESNTEATLYFVACEALANVIKHASATKAAVTVFASSDKFILEVHDDGCGGASFSEGTGLVGCDDRVRTVGGDFEITSSPMLGGTLVKARIPL